MKTSEKTIIVSLVQICVLIFVSPAASEFNLKIEELNSGRVCAKLQCTYTGGDASVPMEQASFLEFVKTNAEGGEDAFYAALQEDDGTWVEDQNIPPDNIAKTQTTDFSLQSTDTTVVLEVFVERLTGLADDVNVCDEEELEKYACFLIDKDKELVKATVEKTTRKPDVEQSRPADGQTVTYSVLEVMTTLADAVEKFNFLMDQRSDMVKDTAEKTREDIWKDIQDYLVSVSSVQTNLANEVQVQTEDNVKLLDETKTNTNKSLSASTAELEKAIEGLSADLDKTLESTNTNITTSVNELQKSVNDLLGETDQNSDKALQDLDSFLKESFETLNTNIRSLKESAHSQVTSTSNTVETELSVTANTTKNNFDTLRQNASQSFEELQGDFNTKVQNLESALEDSVSVSTQKMITDANSLETKFDEQIDIVLTSIMEISTDLDSSVQKTSEDVISFLNEVESNLTKEIEAVENDLGTQAESLLDQISQQRNSTENKIASTSTTVLNVIDNSTDSLAKTSEDSTQNIREAIDKVDKDLNEKDTNLQTEIRGIDSSLASDIESVNERVAEQIRNADNSLVTTIETLNTGVTDRIDVVESEQSVASSSNLGKTTEQVKDVQTTITERIDTLNVTIRQNIDELQESTSKELDGIDNLVTEDLDTIADYVDAMSIETQGSIKTFADETSDNIALVRRDVIEDLEKLQSLTVDFVDNVNMETASELNNMDTNLDTSLQELNTKTMQNIRDVEKKTREELEGLQQQASGIHNQVVSLTEEISDEQNLITGLQDKYVHLTSQLNSITKEIDDYQSALTTHQDATRTSFTDANADIDEKGANTLKLLSNLVTKIKGMNNNMTSALEVFHERVEQLSGNIVEIGTRVTGFTHSNIDQISEHMTENTEIITDYLQPKKCTRNMNYVSISNNQYVVIAANDESEIDFDILCDTAADGGGWIIIQYRNQDDVSFYKTWEEYKQGFGSLHTSFYMGNELIHQLTSKNDYELRITMETDEQEFIAEYKTFRLDSEANKYTLHATNYSGTAGDALYYHSGHPFSTRDVDNDNYRRSCASNFKSGWWYDNCRKADLNGEWSKHVHWLVDPLQSETSPIYSTEMKIRVK